MFTKSLTAALAAAAVLTAVFTATPASAQGCATSDEVTTLMVAEIQQRLMVAAYTCHYVEYYNRLVLTHRAELRKSDKRMLHLFTSHDGGAVGDDEYNAFKTRLANLSSRESNEYPGTFCYRAQQLFTAVLYQRRPLASLAASERPYSALPFDSCGR